MKKIKILRIITRINNGGPAKHAIWLNALLNKKIFETIMVTGQTDNSEDDIAWYAQKYGVEPIVISCLRKKMNLFWDFISIVKIYTIIRKENPDILHTHMSKAGFLGRYAALVYNFFHREKIRIVHTFHGHIFHSYFSYLKTAFFVFLERILVCKTDVLIAISEKLKEEISVKLKINNDKKFRIIPLGVDFIPMKRKKMQKKGDVLTIGMLGRLVPIKNIPLAIEIAGILQKRDFPAKILIGGSGTRDDFKKMNRYNLKNIIFMGNVREPAEFWIDVDIALITSKNEGTPVSLIEAMYSGIPFIAPYVGGIPDMTMGICREENNFLFFDNCILIKGFDPTDFVWAIQFYSNPQSRLKAGRFCLQLAEKKYAIARLLKDIDILYRNLNKA